MTDSNPSGQPIRHARTTPIIDYAIPRPRVRHWPILSTGTKLGVPIILASVLFAMIVGLHDDPFPMVGVEIGGLVHVVTRALSDKSLNPLPRVIATLAAASSLCGMCVITMALGSLSDLRLYFTLYKTAHLYNITPIQIMVNSGFLMLVGGILIFGIVRWFRWRSKGNLPFAKDQ